MNPSSTSFNVNVSENFNNMNISYQSSLNAGKIMTNPSKNQFAH